MAVLVVAGAWRWKQIGSHHFLQCRFLLFTPSNPESGQTAAAPHRAHSTISLGHSRHIGTDPFIRTSGSTHDCDAARRSFQAAVEGFWFCSPFPGPERNSTVETDGLKLPGGCSVKRKRLLPSAFSEPYAVVPFPC
ncbi:hypothetical protein Y1Q_0007252 [Alligator mississippiensis]|uniref:Uncharacterized protein n=1 Tax=Alligator mississippiensis TaxID=8496 RepID=A0A151NMY1_ALLMI|nr:hypothetical protein Y1Q_0007252 [Alligator mississippiensis]